MALVGVDFNKGDRRPACVQRMHHRARFAGGKEPVRREGHHAKARARALEGLGQRAIVFRDVEIIHGAGDIEIGVRVKALDEARALMAQIALDLKIRIEGESGRGAVLQLAPEFALQGFIRKVSDMGRHARHREALEGAHTVVEITPGAPFGIGHHGLTAHFMEGDVLRGVTRRRRDGHGAEDALGIGGRPLQHLHAAHGAARHAKELVDAQAVDEHGLSPHHVADRHDRQVEPPGATRRGIDGGGASGAHAAAQHIRADDEIAVGVDGLARAHHDLPPAGLARHRMDIRHMLVARQGVADEHRVGLVRVQGSIGLISDGEGGQIDARIHGQRLVSAEMRHLALGRIDFPQSQITGRF